MSATIDQEATVGGLLDVLDLGVCAVDARGAIIDVNPAWLRLAGAVVPPLTGTSFAEWAQGTAGGMAGGMAEVARAVQAALDVVSFDAHHELSVPVAGDRPRELDLHVRRLDRPAASGAQVLVTAQDLAALSRAGRQPPERLVERERLEMVARYSDSSFAVLDPDGVIEWISDTFVALSGIARKEAIGRCRWELVRGPFAGTEAFTRFRAEVDAGRATSVEAPLHRPDGSLYWVSWMIQPVYRDGTVVKLLSVQREITKRRRAEEMARQTLIRAQRLGAELRQEKQLIASVLTSVPTGVWWKDTELVYLGCNRAYVSLRGVSGAAELIGRTEAQLPVADVFGTRREELEPQVLASSAPVTDQRITVVEPGQPLRTFLVCVLPRWENKKLVGVLGVCTDVSQVSELERQVSQTSRLESIGQLAAGIAHEINTPVQYASDNLRFVTESFQSLLDGLNMLQAISGECGDSVTRKRLEELLTDLDLDFLAEEVPSALAQSQEGLGRVAQIVRAMKEFSHPGGERVPTDINQLVESTIQVSRNEWKYVSRLEHDLAGDVGEIPCFAGDVKQALLNIVVNAAHAVDERRRRQGVDELGLITVTTCRTGDEVVITVADDGIGMDEEVRRRIFDPFFTTKGVGKGTGQGLSLAHSAIVTKHHGRIDVSSAPMRGTSFAIALPIVDVSADTGPDAAAGPAAGKTIGQAVGQAVGPAAGPVNSFSPEAIG